MKVKYWASRLPELLALDPRMSDGEKMRLLHGGWLDLQEWVNEAVASNTGMWVDTANQWAAYCVSDYIEDLADLAIMGFDPPPSFTDWRSYYFTESYKSRFE